MKALDQYSALHKFQAKVWHLDSANANPRGEYCMGKLKLYSKAFKLPFHLHGLIG